MKPSPSSSHFQIRTSVVLFILTDVWETHILCRLDIYMNILQRFFILRTIWDFVLADDYKSLQIKPENLPSLEKVSLFALNSATLDHGSCLVLWLSLIGGHLL